MREAHSPAVDDHDPGCRCLHEGLLELPLPVGHQQHVQGRPGEGRRSQEDITCSGRELCDTPADCVQGGRWHPNQCVGVVGDPVFGEQRRYFLAEQRISVAGHVELPQHRCWKSIAATHDGLERRLLERADLEDGEAPVRSGDLDRTVAGAEPGRKTDLLGFDAPKSELQRAQ